MKDKIKIIVDRFNAPTPKFWKKVRLYMIVIGGASGVIVLSGPLLPIIMVKLASYGVTTGALGTALSQLAKIKEND